MRIALATFFAAFLAFAAATLLVVSIPWLPGPLVEDEHAPDIIVPLNARDPSALVMGPAPVYYPPPKHVH